MPIKIPRNLPAYDILQNEGVMVMSSQLAEKQDIQTYLSNNGFNPGIIDGEMGSYTKEAIKAFQRKVGLIPDGVAGNRTKSAMRQYTGC